MKAIRSLSTRVGGGSEFPGLALTMGSLFLAFFSAVLGWHYATVVLLIISVLGEWFLHRDAPDAAKLLRQSGLGIPMRFGIRVVAVLLVVEFDSMWPLRAFVVGAIVFVLVLCARTLHTEYYRVGPLRPMETRNIPDNPTIATEPPTHHFRLVVTELLVLAPALVEAPGPLILVLSLVGAIVLVVSSIPDARATWRMRQQKRATGFTGPLRQLQTYIDNYQPEVLLHLSGPANAGYQINTWLNTLESLDQRVLIIVRNKPLFENMAQTSLPIIRLNNAGELMMLTFSAASVALYPTNTGNNIHLLRLPNLMSAFIGHGDSDKSASINPFSRVYDELWVAGEAGADRYRKSGLGIHESQYRHVGRPQVHAVSQSPGLGADDVPTLLYAPTWEGVNLEQEYSSVAAIGKSIIKAALSSPKPVRVVYKPHPFTGRRDAKYHQIHADIMAMIRTARGSSGIDHLVVGNETGEPSLNDCFNQSTAMVGDISSVVSDYLASEKPYAVFNHEGTTREEFVHKYPSTAAATILERDGSGISDFLEVVTGRRPDDFAAARVDLSTYLLGPAENRSIEAFQHAIDALAARANAERFDYRPRG